MSRLRTARMLHKRASFADHVRNFNRLHCGDREVGIGNASDWRWAHYYDRPLHGLRAVVSIDPEWADTIKHDAFIAFMQDHGPNALRSNGDTIELHVRDVETAAMARLAL